MGGRACNHFFNLICFIVKRVGKVVSFIDMVTPFGMLEVSEITSEAENTACFGIWGNYSVDHTVCKIS